MDSEVRHPLDRDAVLLVPSEPPDVLSLHQNFPEHEAETHSGRALVLLTRNAVDWIEDGTAPVGPRHPA